jgi:hypothetical protein
VSEGAQDSSVRCALLEERDNHDTRGGRPSTPLLLSPLASCKPKSKPTCAFTHIHKPKPNLVGEARKAGEGKRRKLEGGGRGDEGEEEEAKKANSQNTTAQLRHPSGQSEPYQSPSCPAPCTLSLSQSANQVAPGIHNIAITIFVVGLDLRTPPVPAGTHHRISPYDLSLRPSIQYCTYVGSTCGST